MLNCNFNGLHGVHFEKYNLLNQDAVQMILFAQPSEHERLILYEHDNWI